jgi:hypothetical protein
MVAITLSITASTVSVTSLPVSIAVTITAVPPITVMSTVMVPIPIPSAPLVAASGSVVTSAGAIELVFVTYPASWAIVVVIAATIAVSIAIAVTTRASRAAPAVVGVTAAWSCALAGAFSLDALLLRLAFCHFGSLLEEFVDIFHVHACA